jgi:hypothetical protein
MLVFTFYPQEQEEHLEMAQQEVYQQGTCFDKSDHQCTLHKLFEVLIKWRVLTAWSLNSTLVPADVLYASSVQCCASWICSGPGGPNYYTLI